MKKEIIDVPGISEHLKKANVPLSAVVKAGDFIFVSGLPAIDPKTGTIPIADITKQTEGSLENIKRCLEAAGSSLDKVVKCTVYITNAAYFEQVNAVYRKYFDRDPPARVFCTVGSWPWPFDIEIECVAIA
jgi:2-iminobutanoate/2-iminopropanoate deaminase